MTKLAAKEEVLVLGAGVSGLSTGLLLLDEGYRVNIWAKDLPPNTTSNAAAAVWYPFHVDPPEKVAEWAGKTLDFFLEHVINDEKSGVYRNKIIEIFPNEEPDPFWKKQVKTFERLRGRDLPQGYNDGYTVEGVVMVTDIYMQYLINKFKERGGVIERKTVNNLEEVVHNHKLVVNCTGMGSRELAHDFNLYPCRGQIIRVENNGFPYTVFEEKGPNSLAYIIPRKDDIILGGTLGNEDDWSLEINPQTTQEILKRCSALYPEVEKAKVLGAKVGLRPGRKGGIRLESESLNGGTVIHNYGHGGAGFTLSWGCSSVVVDMISRVSA